MQQSDIDNNDIQGSRSIALSLDSVWLKAAVLGGIWASVEIILGSFMHNLRIPFSGSILASFGIILMISFHYLWPVRGLIWRAGIICALMKSVSPSAVILGPMTGIMLEAFLMSLTIYVLGNNLVAYIIGGAVSLLSALVHKLISLLILYGFNIVQIYVNIFYFAAKQVKISDADPWVVIYIMIAIYVIMGGLSALLGSFIGRRSRSIAGSGGLDLDNINDDKAGFFTIGGGQTYSIGLFFLHVAAIPLMLLVMNSLPLHFALIPVASYLLICVLFYKNAVKRLRKRVFWVQLLIITILAAIFWGRLGNDGSSKFEGLWIGLEMNLRAVFVVVAFTCLSIELKNPMIKDFLFRFNFNKLYLSIELAFSILPVMLKATPSPKMLFRQPVTSVAYVISKAEALLHELENEAK